MKKNLLFPLAAFLLQWSGSALSADFVVVRIEAEDFTSKSDRWALTSDTQTPNLGPDPDPPHHSNASGRANLELLPDTRVTHDDPIGGGPDGSFWGGPGGGPRIDYNVNMPEAGRYLVYVKTYSTGTEDNGLHVGLNNTKPDSGEKIQICSKHNWFWTSGQRTNDNHCGVTKTIWLDIPAAGPNTITFWAREDGYEIDQFLLLKETHDGSLDCFPTFADKMRCRNIATGQSTDTEMPVSQTIPDGTTPDPIPPAPVTPLAEVDLDIDINSIGTTHFVNDTIEYRIKVTNNDTLEEATDTVATMTLPTGLQFNSSSDCTESASIVTCNYGNLAAGSNATLSFFATALSEGNHRVDGQVMADQDDNIGNNNTESETITASLSVPDYEAGIALQQSHNATSIGGVNTYTVLVQNNGLQPIDSAALQISTGSGVVAMDCNPNCAVPTIQPGAITTVSFDTIASLGGVHNVTAELLLDNDADPANNTATLSETVIDSPIAASSNGEVVVEAEAFSSNSPAATENAPGWFLINGSYTPLAAMADTDQASPGNASGQAYIEALPDTRIDANAAAAEGISNFTNGGTGATLSYDVFFNQAGEYTVYARIRANNTQDSSLHIGLNNEWSGNTLAVCNPDGSWQWSNSTSSAGTCNTTTAMTLTIPAPGLHQLMISQDTDGLELDKLVLRKTPASAPTDLGPAVTLFDPSTNADLSTNSSLSKQESAEGETIDLSVSVTNNSADTDSVGVTITVDGVQPDDLQTANFDTCVSSGNGVSCSLSTLQAGTTVTETFTVTSVSSLNINSTVESAIPDNNNLNDTDTVTLTVVNASNKATTGNGGNSSGGGSLTLWLLALLLLTGITRERFTRQQNRAPVPMRAWSSKH